MPLQATPALPPATEVPTATLATTKPLRLAQVIVLIVAVNLVPDSEAASSNMGESV